MPFVCAKTSGRDLFGCWEIFKRVFFLDTGLEGFVAVDRRRNLGHLGSLRLIQMVV